MTAALMDVQGAPSLVGDFLLKSEVPFETKEWILDWILGLAASSPCFYAKSRAELVNVLRTLLPAFADTPLLSDLAGECMEELQR